MRYGIEQLVSTANLIILKLTGKGEIQDQLLSHSTSAAVPFKQSCCELSCCMKHQKGPSDIRTQFVSE